MAKRQGYLVRGTPMRQMKSIFTFLLVGCSNIALAPMTRTARMVLVEQNGNGGVSTARPSCCRWSLTLSGKNVAADPSGVRRGENHLCRGGDACRQVWVCPDRRRIQGRTNISSVGETPSSGQPYPGRRHVGRGAADRRRRRDWT